MLTECECGCRFAPDLAACPQCGRKAAEMPKIIAGVGPSFPEPPAALAEDAAEAAAAAEEPAPEAESAPEPPAEPEPAPEPLHVPVAPPRRVPPPVPGE